MTTDTRPPIIVQRSPVGGSAGLVPVPATPIVVRTATMADLPFIDGLQRRHTNQVGWMPTKQLQEKIAKGQVVVAEERHEGIEERHEGIEARRHEGAADAGTSSALFVPSCLRASVPIPTPAPLGYLIGQDQYFKRDDVGIIYQVNVVPGRRRGLVGATLVKAMLERAAYGCRLFCCWCAQDIEANRFWASLGFVPLAFRTGSRSRLKGKPRVHIFWQRRVRSGDASTPWWFPSQTSSGAIREDRLVLPIPAGMKWDDEMPVLLPSGEGKEGREAAGETGAGEATALATVREARAVKALPGPGGASGAAAKAGRAAAKAGRAAAKAGGLAPKVSLVGLRFAMPAAGAKPAEAKAVGVKAERGEMVLAGVPATGVRLKNDPKQVAMARELRDRWLEAINGDAAGVEMPAEAGKYDVGRKGRSRQYAGVENAER